jgi:hypothetical protein
VADRFVQNHVDETFGDGTQFGGRTARLLPSERSCIRLSSWLQRQFYLLDVARSDGAVPSASTFDGTTGSASLSAPTSNMTHRLLARSAGMAKSAGSILYAGQSIP